MPHNIYGELMGVKERLGPLAVASDTLDNDLGIKLEDASDFIIMKLEEFPRVFPTPSGFIGNKKSRLDRITNDLASALYVEDRSMRARARDVNNPELERWAVIWRKRAMMELEQFIRTESMAVLSTPFDAFDITKIKGTGLEGSSLDD